MRELLFEIFPENPVKCDTPEEYTALLENIYEISKSERFGVMPPAKIILPGLVSPPSNLLREYWSTQVYERILSSGPNITVKATDYDSASFTEGLLLTAGKLRTNAKITVLTERKAPKELLKIIFKLWQSGLDVTICSMKGGAKALEHVGFEYRGYAVFDARLMIPGKTALTFAEISMARFSGCHDFESLYQSIKKTVREILENEVIRRFNRSRRGKLYFRPAPEYCSLEPWGFFYPDSIGSADDPHVRGIFTGGAAHDVVSISFTGVLETSRKLGISLGDAIRCIGAACKACDDFPIKAEPFFKDVRHVQDVSEILNALREHSCAAHHGIRGGAILELHVPAVNFPSFDMLCSVVPGFLGLGGTMLKIIPHGGPSD